MRTLLEFYDITKAFADGHLMINEFGLLGSEEELQGLDFKHRSMQLIVANSNISRELNAPTYSIEFSVVMLDKTISDDDRAELQAIEENLFVVSQFQDYLLQQDISVEFDEVDFVTVEDDDYNIVVAYSNFSVTFERSNHNGGVAILNYQAPNSGGGSIITPEDIQQANSYFLGDSIGVPSTEDPTVATGMESVKDSYVWAQSTLTNQEVEYEIYLVFFTRQLQGIGDPYPNNEAVVYSGTFTTPSEAEMSFKIADGKTMNQIVNENLAPWVADSQYLIGIRYFGNPYHADAIQNIVNTTAWWLDYL